MRAFYSKLLAIMLSVVITGAAHICLCAEMTEPTVPAADPHACCNSADGKKTSPPPTSEDPCKDCNLRHQQVANAPEKSLLVSGPDLLLFSLSAIDLARCDALIVQPSHRVTDDMPIPPLLQDLYHTFCLLTL
jgi:hypothetical protein